MKTFNCKKIWVLSAVALLLHVPVFPVVKQHYGGNIKIAEDLTAGLAQVRLFGNQEDTLYPLLAMSFSIRDQTLKADLSTLPADRISEMESAIASLQQPDHPCHWILDYPYFHHEHRNSVSIEKDQLTLTVSEPEFLHSLAQSSCLIPERIGYLLPFIKTQFGYEANQNHIGGRPFLDSISPVAIDPQNPYLAFKLNEADAFLIPEEKFRQIVADEQIQILPGPQYFLYLKSEHLTQPRVLTLTSALDLNEISKAVLNDHVELYLEQTSSPGEIFNTPIYFKIPEEAPFRLIGERIRVQLENRGFLISTKALPRGAPTLELAIEEVRESDLDLFRYRLLRNNFKISQESSWYEQWDQLEASGTIVPLLLYESRIAVRNNLIGVLPGAGGIPDFSNAWLLPPR